VNCGAQAFDAAVTGMDRKRRHWVHRRYNIRTSTTPSATGSHVDDEEVDIFAIEPPPITDSRASAPSKLARALLS